MKKRTPLIVVIFLLVALVAAGGQAYLKRHLLQERIVQAIEHSLHAKASVASVEWQWLPVPAITITQLKVESDSLVLAVPKTHLILSPISFFSGSVSLLRAQLIDPDLDITKLSSTDSFSNKTMRLGSIRITNGKLHLPTQALSKTIGLEPISLTNINGTLSARPNRGNFTLSANTSFSQLLNLNGSIDFPVGAYQMDINATGFTSERLIHDQSASPLLPQITNMTFSSHIEGLNANHFTLRLFSKDSPFFVQENNQTAAVTAIDCVLNRHNADFALDLHELSLSDPAMTLSGRVSRQENNTAQPEWDIDVTGTEINLAAVRRAIAKRFPSNPIAQKVCGIVQGGSATTARYMFKGEVSDFHHVQSMKIWADAKDVPVIIPGVKLVLDRASGPISIIDGQLTGKNLTADIDKSHGKNGTLLVDLRHDHHAFTLDLDLTVDLNNLKTALTQVVHGAKFQQELKKFTAIKGQAKGHLRLGDELHHIQTNVDVISMQAKGKYNRLPWPFTITGGSLIVGPQQVEWHDVQGSIGKQQISKTHGSVDWYEDIELSIDTLDADLDLKTLFEEGSLATNTTPLTIRDFFRGKLVSLTGNASIANTSFWGHISQPEQWRFATKASSNDLLLTGPSLAELTSHSVQGEINQQELRFSGIFSTLNDELFLTGFYTHQLLDRWQGTITINGDIGEQLGAWMRAKQFLPTALFPNLPFRLEQFSVSTPGATATAPLKAHGTIISLVQGSAARVEIDFTRQPDQVVEKLTFIDGPHSGTLTYLSWPLHENHSLLTWQGELNVHTFNDLFPQNFLEDGSIQGSFTRLAQNESALYNGEVQLTKVSFRPESIFPDISIDALRLAGDSHNLLIEQADITLADSQVHASGTISDDQGRHTLDLTVTAPTLSSTAINKTLESAKKMGDANQRSSFRRTLNGHIAFNINKFDYVRTTPKELAPKEVNSQALSITPFKGEIVISPVSTDLTFDSSRVCGISIQGSWHFNNKKTDNTISFSSGPSPLYFERALPCLGFKQSLIVGPFIINGEVSGHPKNWSNGTIILSSQEGMIKRMNLLSEIFTAVNFTDYFTWQDMPNMNEEGLAFNNMTMNAHIENNTLTLDNTSIRGKGVNLTGRGSINLTSLDSDLTFFIAPFKMVDSLVTGIPLIGKALGGSKNSILTFPVKVTGNIKAPEVTALAPEALGTAAWELLLDTLTLPFRILQPDE